MISEAQQALLNDEMDTVCAMFAPTGSQALIIAVVTNDDGDVHYQFRRTESDDPDVLLNYGIGLADALQSVLRAGR